MNEDEHEEERATYRVVGAGVYYILIGVVGFNGVARGGGAGEVFEGVEGRHA
jgi:hypothetical protein